MKKSGSLHPLLWVLIFLILAFFLAMGSDSFTCFLGKLFGIKTCVETDTGGKKEALQFLGWIISGVAGLYGLLILGRRLAAQGKELVKEFVAYLEKLFPLFIAIAGVLGFISILAFVGVMFSDRAAYFVGELLGTGIEEGKKETLQFLGWMTSGLIAFFGLFAINRRVAAQERGLVQDRFKVAVDHLANEQASARIASFYEFFYLARDVSDYAKNILGILCAHLRHTKDAEDPEQKLTEPQTLVDILFSSEAENVFRELYYNLQRAHLPKIDFQNMHKPKGKVNFSAADLREAVFNNTDLSGFNFQKAKLHKTKFEGANLQDANLFEADLSSAELFRANLSGADLRGANLSNADLFRADLSDTDLRGVDLSSAELSKANLSSADLRGVDLSGADLRRANLSSADLFKADLSGADLRGVDLRKAKNLQTAYLSDAGYDDDTQFPEGLDPEDHEE